MKFASIWLAFFSQLPDGARVLDVGTGNGIVAFLARDAAKARGRNFHIEGIDAAIIDPAAVYALCPRFVSVEMT